MAVRALGLKALWLIAIVLIAVGPFLRLKAQQHNSTTPSLDYIVTQMEEARSTVKATEPFQLTREYQMFHGDDATPASEVKAEINVVPPRDRDFKIVEAKGSDRGEKVVRKILEHEAKAEKSDPAPTAIVRQNYDFSYAGEARLDGLRCYLLQLHPKRKDTSLVEGTAWVDANSYLVRKIEGDLSKSPSWMVKSVKLTVLFGEVGGVWMQTMSHAIADVRILGKYVVEGRALNVQTASSVASIRPKKNSMRGRSVLPAEALYQAGPLVTR
jgi:hypothetical protein